jgi:hypothetical protein
VIETAKRFTHRYILAAVLFIMSGPFAIIAAATAVLANALAATPGPFAAVRRCTGS